MDIKETDFNSARNIVRSYQATIADAIQNSIVLPDNATNGNMIKAMFPDLVNSNMDLVDVLNNARSLWNAPYKGNLSEKPTGSESEE